MSETIRNTIIVLGGGRLNEGDLTNLSTQRLDKGIELYQQGVSGRFFALGGQYSTYREEAIRFDKTGAALRKDYLFAHGVPSENIELVSDGRDTLYEAFASRERIKKLGITSIYLVTSDKHMRRASHIFQRILGDRVTVQEVDVPCGDLLNEKEEERYFELVNRLFDTLPKNIPTPTDWDTWYGDNRWFYDEQAKIHQEFLNGKTETNQAYMGVRDKS